MKILIRIGFTLVLGLFLLSCSNQYVNPDSRPKGRDYSMYSNLSEILRTEPGIFIQGSGNNTRVYIRGISTIKLETQPLYIVDGVPIGNSYAMANNSVNTANIESIRVIKDTSQLVIYGEDGTNGVILIKTKTANR